MIRRKQSCEFPVASQSRSPPQNRGDGAPPSIFRATPRLPKILTDIKANSWLARCDPNHMGCCVNRSAHLRQESSLKRYQKRVLSNRHGLIGILHVKDLLADEKYVLCFHVRILNSAFGDLRAITMSDSVAGFCGYEDLDGRGHACRKSNV